MAGENPEVWDGRACVACVACWTNIAGLGRTNEAHGSDKPWMECAGSEALWKLISAEDCQPGADIATGEIQSLLVRLERGIMYRL